MKILFTALVVSLVAVAASAGQRSDTSPAALPSAEPSLPAPSPGWTLTPSILTSRTHDDNVLLAGPGDPTNPDYVNIINPRGELLYHGRRSDVTFRYDGAFIRYTDLNALDSYDQHGSVALKQRLSKRTSFFLTGNATAAPTTELLGLAVPWVRAGVVTDEVRAGFENTGKRFTYSVGGRFQQAHFRATQTFANLLLGGDAIGADVSIRQRLSAQTTLTADASTERETIGQARQVFDVQHAVAGIEQRFSDTLRVFAAAGVSHLGETEFGPARNGPSFRLGLSQRYHTTLLEVAYDRSFVPSFSFGGLTQNGSLSGRVQVPITRRLYTRDLISWVQQDPIIADIPQLRSVWVESAVGYAATQWIHVEAFYARTQQNVGNLDAPLLHNQYGVQVIASKPVRIR